jgi:uridine monophosphate synthetase
VYEQGTDVVIVGRGIIKADDPGAEAERYRVEAWRAYEERIGLGRR